VGLLKSFSFYKLYKSGWDLLIHLSRSNRWVNKADVIQTGCEHFLEIERIEGCQEMLVSLHRGPIQYIFIKQRANIYDSNFSDVTNTLGKQ